MHRIENFLTEDEYDQIIAFYHSLPDAPEYSSNRSRRKLMHYDLPEYPLMKQILDPKMKHHFGENVYVSSAAFTTWVYPNEVHNDAWQPHEDNTHKLSKAVLIPMFTDPEDYVTSTVEFNQTYTESAVTLEVYTEDEDWNIAEYITPNDERVVGLGTEPFDKEFHQKYLKHIDYDSLNGFTVRDRYEWKKLSAIVFDRESFHTSANFDGLNSKTHMVFLLAEK